MLTKRGLNGAILVLALIAVTLASMGEGFHGSYGVAKGATTVAVIALLWRFGERGQLRYFNCTLVGLCFCLLGDVLLLKDSFFVFGLAAFLVGHVFFLISFICLHGFSRYYSPLLWFGAVGVGYYSFLQPRLEALAVPVLAYFVAIIVMCWQGVALSEREPSRANTYIGIGVVLFLISDATIALDKFVVPFAASSALILTTYWLAIALLANAATLPREEIQ